MLLKETMKVPGHLKWERENLKSYERKSWITIGKKMISRVSSAEAKRQQNICSQCQEKASTKLCWYIVKLSCKSGDTGTQMLR